MSQTRATVRLRIWELLGDMNPNERVVSQPRLHEVMDRNINLLLGRTMQHTSTPVSITVTSASADYSVDSTVDVRQVVQVFDSTNNRELFYLPFSEFNSFYQQDNTSVQTGLPIHYTLYEASGQLIKIRLGPKPNSSLTLKVYRVAESATLPTSDGSSIPFSDALTRGLEAACVADLIGMLSDDKLGKLGLSRSSRDLFRQQAERAIRDHNNKEWANGRRQDRIIRRLPAGNAAGWY